MPNKKKLSVTIDPELVKWIDKKIKEKEFSSRSHAIEKAIFNMKK